MVACQVFEQIMGLQYMLCMLCFALDGPAWLIGDNCSVVTSHCHTLLCPNAGMPCLATAAEKPCCWQCLFEVLPGG